MFYSKSTGGFYSEKYHGDNIPKDAVEITDEEYESFKSAPLNGKVVDFGLDGRPFLKDAPGPTDAEISQSRRLQIIDELLFIDAESARPLRAIAIGTATDADRAKLEELDSKATVLRAELSKLK